MRFIDKLKLSLSKIFKRNDNFLEEEIIERLPIPEVHEPIELPEGELISFSDEVLDTNSNLSTEKLKHNLKILIEKAKEKGKVDKFMLIREDDYFPTDWEWKVSSKNTSLDKICTPLSYELRKAYALEQSGISKDIEIM